MDDRIIKEYSEEIYLDKFGESKCPRCSDNHVKCYVRTKGKNEYRVYVCNKCKVVLGREMN